MGKNAAFLVILVATIGSGVIGGLFFAFSNFVMQALGRLPPAQGAAAMQSINISVQNPLFFLVFFGTALSCLTLSVMSAGRWGEPGAALVLAGSLLYLAGSIGVTIFVNVPLNNALAKLDPATAEAAAHWSGYLSRWTSWNHVRAAASIAAALSLTLALSSP